MDLILLLKALVLGIVEGVTEFLPISSTGHLIVVGDLLNYNDEQSKVFKIVIQLAAILAVCWDFRARITQVVGGYALTQYNNALQRSFSWDFYRRWCWVFYFTARSRLICSTRLPWPVR